MSQRRKCAKWPRKVKAIMFNKAIALTMIEGVIEGVIESAIDRAVGTKGEQL